MERRFNDRFGNPLEVGDIVAVASRQYHLGIIVGVIIRMDKSVAIRPLDGSRAYTTYCGDDCLKVNAVFEGQDLDSYLIPEKQRR